MRRTVSFVAVVGSTLVLSVGVAGASGSGEAAAKQIVVRFYTDRILDKATAAYSLLWKGQADNAFTLDDWNNCLKPDEGPSFDPWAIAHLTGPRVNGIKRTDGVKVSNARSVTISPSGYTGSIRGLEFTEAYDDKSPGWRIVVNDVGNPCGLPAYETTPTS
jgi:hypothetical protein